MERRKKSDNRLIDFCFTPSPLFIPRSNPRFGVGWRAEFEVTGKICYTVVEFYEWNPDVREAEKGTCHCPLHGIRALHSFFAPLTQNTKPSGRPCLSRLKLMGSGRPCLSRLGLLRLREGKPLAECGVNLQCGGGGRF